MKWFCEWCGYGAAVSGARGRAISMGIHIKRCKKIPRVDKKLMAKTLEYLPSAPGFLWCDDVLAWPEVPFERVHSHERSS